ncbi:ABC transporter permease [Roseburia sp. 1XD42-69]|uniref:ABC transporter permease n=1 Tax=Roseburia sp. 1XD42-69 TaxID=2320088 RepID=UPI000EA144D6|nr:ABC transporter permease [Roseburia sp. 1XD42-69]RKJ61260.1 ABC transporter permease [Roseburia sp. 1XD42-69]
MFNSEKGIKLHRYFIKNYKKNTIAIFFSFALTFMLLTVMLVLIHTNHKISNIQLKTEFTPSDCYVDGLSGEQIELLQNDPEIKWTALQQGTYDLYGHNGQKVYLTKNDDAAITMMTKITDGRLPQKSGEIVAERWVLLNLGIEPVIDQEVSVINEETGEEKEFKLVGILSDSYGNKKYGLLDLYAVMEENSTESYLAYIRFQDSVNYESKVKTLQKELDVSSEQIKECPARENPGELYLIDVGIISVLLLICLVVFYGVYRIAVLSRVQQYGILRAVGMKRRQICKMVLLELYNIYCVSVPIGILCGLCIAWLVLLISGDRSAEVYLCNETVRFRLVIPVWQIMVCVVVTFLLISVIGYMFGKKVTRFSAIDMISGKETEEGKRLFHIQNADSKTGTLFRMSCKYIVKDLKTSGFVILTICLGITLFTGLTYKAKTLELYRDDTKEMYYLNGEYALTMLYFDDARAGISRQNAAKIENLEGIKAVKTSSGFPIRVIDEEGVERNDTYYNERNEALKELYGYGKSGYDGKNQIYKSMLLGYNTDALEALKKYVVEGDSNLDDLGEDEIILSVLRMDDTKNNELPGYYKEGTPLMGYHAGDEISIKYRKDLQTNSSEYEALEDYDAEYVYKTYRVKVIVSFPYMFDCNKTLYPLLITADRYVQEIAPESGIQCMYCDGDADMDLSRQDFLEQQLIRIGSVNSNVSTRSLIAETKQNEMFYHKQMVYIYGISIITFILVMINMINNFRYRMQKRTREICMLRAIGMSVSMTKRVMLFENLILGLAAVLIAFVLSHPVLKYLYGVSDMRAFGHEFHFAYIEFLFVATGALVICIFLSFGILKSWKTKQITEGIGSFE